MTLIRIVSLFPARWIYFWFRLAAHFAYYISRYRGEVIRTNISNSFPEYSREQVEATAKAFYYQFMEVFAESIIAYRFSKADWEKHFHITNPHELKSLLDAGQPIILLSGHTCNWEWPAHAIVSQLKVPMEFLYKPIQNERYERIMFQLRTRHGGQPIPKDSAISAILKRKNEARVIGIIGDQIPSKSTEKKWVNFLNQESAFYVGAEKIARAVGYPVFFAETHRVKRGYYSLTFRMIAKPPYGDDPKIIETYTRMLEASIRRHPADYLWSHRRWKYSREQAKAS